MLLHLLKLVLWSNTWSTLVKVPSAPGKNEASCWVKCPTDIKVNWLVMLFTSLYVLHWYFGLVWRWINEGDVLKSLMIIGMPQSPFNAVKICFVYFKGPMLTTYTFIYDCYVVLMNWPFYHCECPSLPMVILFFLKCILPDINIATPTCLHFPFAQHIFSHLFTSTYLYLMFKVHLYYLKCLYI